MQINVLPASHPTSFSSMIFPKVSVAAKAWVDDQLQAGSRLYENLMGGSFMQHITQLKKKLEDPLIEKTARNLTRQVKGMFHPNEILPLTTIAELQSAQPAMQRWIMAMPMYRELYHKQLCDGYSDSYVDTAPGVVGEDHYDYRRVTEGIVQMYNAEDDQGKYETWKVSTHFEDLQKPEDKLGFDNQCMILDAWDLAEKAILEKIDPCDIFNGRIGG